VEIAEQDFSDSASLALAESRSDDGDELLRLRRGVDALAHELGKTPDYAKKLPEYRRARAIERVLAGEPAKSVAAEIRLSGRALTRLVESVKAAGLAGLVSDLDERLASLPERRIAITQLLLARLAERRFELLSPRLTAGRTLIVEPQHNERSPAEYLLKDGAGRGVCRLAITFHASAVRDAREVALEPDDCFAVPTHAIHAALSRQEAERVPYLFLVVRNLALRPSSVAASVPEALAWLSAVLDGKRFVDEAVADYLCREEFAARLEGIWRRMSESEFLVISAAKAARVLRERLFERVPALRVSRFVPPTRITMHFSLSQDLVPFSKLVGFVDLPMEVLAARLTDGSLI
jgi:hypothetical protein